MSEWVKWSVRGSWHVCRPDSSKAWCNRETAGRERHWMDAPPASERTCESCFRNRERQR